jgi:hypothetical protein
VTLTRVRTLLGVAVVVWLVSTLVLRLLDRTRGVLPMMPWSVPLVLALLAAGVAFSAVALRRRLRGAPDVKPADPLVAARMVALSKATSHAGAVLVGVYSAFALFLLTVDPSELRRERGITAAVAAVVSIGLAAAGVYLERVLRVDPPEDEEELARR